MPALRRVGHKGADLIVPGNTPASFDAALAAGVDMIEFDVLPERSKPPFGRLLLAHDYADVRRRAPTTLERGLDHLAETPYDGIELDVDLKLPGYERRVVDALRERDMLDRTLVSTQYRRSLRELRALEPRLRIGWSVPRVGKDPSRMPRVLSAPVYARLLAYRRAFPRIAAAALRAGRCDAIMSHWRFVTPPLIRAVKRAGGDLYVWTVDEAGRIAELKALGVTGVISNDPRLFARRADEGSPAGLSPARQHP
jgi:glycerophosphoryl diester phosphodiesterase